MTPGSKSTYHDLIIRFAPRIIRTESEFDAAQDVVDSLVDSGDLTSAETDYLSLLGMLIERYEDEHAVMPELRGRELVVALLKESGLRQKDLLPIFKTESIVSAILNGHRKMTVEHIEKLSAFFDMPYEVFFEQRTQDIPAHGITFIPFEQDEPQFAD